MAFFDTKLCTARPPSKVVPLKRRRSPSPSPSRAVMGSSTKGSKVIPLRLRTSNLLALMPGLLLDEQHENVPAFQEPSESKMAGKSHPDTDGGKLDCASSQEAFIRSEVDHSVPTKLTHGKGAATARSDGSIQFASGLDAPCFRLSEFQPFSNDAARDILLKPPREPAFVPGWMDEGRPASDDFYTQREQSLNQRRRYSDKNQLNLQLIPKGDDLEGENVSLPVMRSCIKLPEVIQGVKSRTGPVISRFLSSLGEPMETTLPNLPIWKSCHDEVHEPADPCPVVGEEDRSDQAAIRPLHDSWPSSPTPGLPLADSNNAPGQSPLSSTSDGEGSPMSLCSMLEGPCVAPAPYQGELALLTHAATLASTGISVNWGGDPSGMIPSAADEMDDAVPTVGSLFNPSGVKSYYGSPRNISPYSTALLLSGIQERNDEDPTYDTKPLAGMENALFLEDEPGAPLLGQLSHSEMPSKVQLLCEYSTVEHDQLLEASLSQVERSKRRFLEAIRATTLPQKDTHTTSVGSSPLRRQLSPNSLSSEGHEDRKIYDQDNRSRPHSSTLVLVTTAQWDAQLPSPANSVFGCDEATHQELQMPYNVDANSLFDGDLTDEETRSHMDESSLTSLSPLSMRNVPLPVTNARDRSVKGGITQLLTPASLSPPPTSRIPDRTQDCMRSIVPMYTSARKRVLIQEILDAGSQSSTKMAAFARLRRIGKSSNLCIEGGAYNPFTGNTGSIKKETEDILDRNTLIALRLIQTTR
ncbi:SubName: Full=Uncharacterized protein {ECO:0000313/EMBL:CCA72157.1} [Serendipita indica DSM 11827]|uniref:Uncharacterized protein n=1 Tax=Serendipita indica (strain DSM 11827) TaxID=1109443 RepID=G4TLG2_SERID|nr:SubName: Full=Uncharacterized protein {ECO:0000313/EMBL:CCA72157.1} [Serendipita indica DSM 11827]CCA72157.1 hypothetical protein PIIN_06092 [Serendipita indica DSM 11827]